MQSVLTRETLSNQDWSEQSNLPLSMPEVETLINETIEALKESDFPPLKLAGAANGVASVALTRGESVGLEEAATEVYEDKLIDLLAKNPDIRPEQLIEHAMVVRFIQHLLRS